MAMGVNPNRKNPLRRSSTGKLGFDPDIKKQNKLKLSGYV